MISKQASLFPKRGHVCGTGAGGLKAKNAHPVGAATHVQLDVVPTTMEQLRVCTPSASVLCGTAMPELSGSRATMSKNDRVPSDHRYK